MGKQGVCPFAHSSWGHSSLNPEGEYKKIAQYLLYSSSSYLQSFFLSLVAACLALAFSCVWKALCLFLSVWSEYFRFSFMTDVKSQALLGPPLASHAEWAAGSYIQSVPMSSIWHVSLWTSTLRWLRYIAFCLVGWGDTPTLNSQSCTLSSITL